MTRKNRDKEIRRALAVQRQLRLLPLAVPLAFVLMVIAIVLSITSAAQLGTVKRNTSRIDAAAKALRIAAIKQCERANDGRVEGNDRALVLRQFLESAAVARENSPTKSDRRTARRYRRLKERVNLLPQVNCARQVVPIIGNLKEGEER